MKSKNERLLELEKAQAAYFASRRKNSSGLPQGKSAVRRCELRLRIAVRAMDDGEQYREALIEDHIDQPGLEVWQTMMWSETQQRFVRITKFDDDNT